MEKNVSLLGLRRGLKVLEILAVSENGLTFNQIRDAFDDLVPSTISRLLKVLIDERMIKLDHRIKCYLLAERSHEIAYLIEEKVPIHQKIQPYLDELAKESRLSSAFFQYKNEKAILMAKSEQPEAFHYAEIGTFPISIKHAFKQICFAHSPIKDQSHNFNQKQINQLKKLPLLINTEDDQDGLTRIVAPLFKNNSKLFIGAIGISFYQKFDKNKLTELGKQVEKISKKIRFYSHKWV